MITGLQPISNANNRGIVVLGSGLIGQSILGALNEKQHFGITRFPSTWNDQSVLQSELAEIQKFLVKNNPDQMDWIWSAGATGFGSNKQTVEDERKVFELFVRTIELTKAEMKKAHVRIHFISSAGGLFEGQESINQHSNPNPKRLYGELKLSQENTLLDKFQDDTVTIYRPSTVYGYIRPGARRGLVTALISNTLSGGVTEINGHLDTLRDYVWAEDAGRFIAGKVMEPFERLMQNHFIVSGVATSIQQVISLVESQTNKKAQHKFQLTNPNSEHITFNPAARPPGFRFTPLDEGVKRIVEDYQSALRG
jgi:nucleoside-diphosphate-sugar epimerase